MNSNDLKIDLRRQSHGFTLVEMLVVIAIMSILMTAGAIGLSGMGGKGVTSGVASAESLFDEARTMAIGKNLRTCVLVAKELDNNKSDNLKRIVVAYENVDLDTGSPVKSSEANPLQLDWVLSSRGAVLPDQTFFSQKFSKLDHANGSGEIPVITNKSQIKSAPANKTTPAKAVTAAYSGTYYIYMFNSQGIAQNIGASFIIGSGVRRANAPVTELPKVTASAKRDFGGFVVWRNGMTSVFRNPGQAEIPSDVKEF